MSRIRSKLTFANVTSMIALMVALSGTALALQNNSVKSRHIANGHVRSSDLGTLTQRYSDSEYIPGGVAHNGAYDLDSVTAECHDDELAISGGGSFVGGSTSENNEAWISESYPANFDDIIFGDTNPRGWAVEGGNDSGKDLKLRAYVLCLRAGS